MKKPVIAFCIALAALAVVSVTSAGNESRASIPITQGGQRFTHADAGVEFALPKGWKATPDGEVITVASADESLQVVFWVPEEDTFDAAVAELDKELAKTIKSMKTVGKPTQDTLNGMPHYQEAGTGVVDGTTIVWGVDVLGAKKPLIILTFAAPDLFERNEAGYGQLLNSIKKIK